MSDYTSPLARAEEALVLLMEYPTDAALLRVAITAALDGPKDQYDCMDDVTLAIHGAICEDSPEECVEWRGRCVKAAEAARAAVLGDES